MKKYLVLMVMVFVVVLGKTAWAGEMKNGQYGFEIKWPDFMTRYPEVEKNEKVLVLWNNDSTLTFEVGLVANTSSKGESFLRSNECVDPIMKATGVIKKHLDTMVTVENLPARKLIYQIDKQRTCGVVLLVANQTYFILVGGSKNKTPAVFQSWFDKQISAFRVKVPDETFSRKDPGSEEDKNNKKPPVAAKEPGNKQKPDPNKDFGSDF